MNADLASRPDSGRRFEDRVLPGVAGRSGSRRRPRRPGPRGSAAARHRGRRPPRAARRAARRCRALSGAYEASQPRAASIRSSRICRSRSSSGLPFSASTRSGHVDVGDLEEQREMGEGRPEPGRLGGDVRFGIKQRVPEGVLEARARSRRGPPCRPWRPRSGRTRRRAAASRPCPADRSRRRGSASGGGRRTGAARA